jgi:hypothetical protein
MFRLVAIQIPQQFAGEEVHFIWDSESEALIYENNEPQQGKNKMNPVKKQ